MTLRKQCTVRWLIITHFTDFKISQDLIDYFLPLKIRTSAFKLTILSLQLSSAHDMFSIKNFTVLLSSISVYSYNYTHAHKKSLLSIKRGLLWTQTPRPLLTNTSRCFLLSDWSRSFSCDGALATVQLAIHILIIFFHGTHFHIIWKLSDRVAMCYTKLKICPF